ncbi:SMI1/KNR4 family protein [Mesorhizobium sp. LCM 4577]|nr:SMI1/KNR4 family protein [Mesorhizobium sp. LCM 4577]
MSAVLAGVSFDLVRIAVRYILTEGQFDPPAEPAVVDGLSARLGVELPKDYTDFLREHNGGEGFVHDNYVVFFKAEELADFNREYEVEKYAPGILLFGSNGGGEGYGFDTQDPNMSIVRVPFVGMNRKLALKTARNIADLFSRLVECK